jgi:hypothetical protein
MYNASFFIIPFLILLVVSGQWLVASG